MYDKHISSFCLKCSLLFQVADVFSENYEGNPKSPSIQYVALQQSLYITTFICVIGGAFFLATAMFIVQDKKAAERQVRGKMN